MKKVFLLSIAAGLAVSSFAQHAYKAGAKKDMNIANGSSFMGSTELGLANKTTNGFDTTVIPVVTDSFYYTNIGATDTLLHYYNANMGSGNDSGYFLGTSIYQLTNFAERYNYNVTTSTGVKDSVQVLGIYAAFKGAHASPSTDDVVFNMWNVAAPVTTGQRIDNGFPGTVVATVTSRFDSIHFNQYQAHWFATPTPYIGYKFFVGISLSYTWASMNGDTLSCLVSGSRVSTPYTVAGGDTTVNNQSVVGTGSTWLDLSFDGGIDADYYMFPIVNAKRDSLHIVGVPGVFSQKNFTFSGNYPNPAVNYTNVVFEVANVTNVTIEVSDMAGRVVKTINNNNLTTGKHTVKIETSDFAAGQYVYLIRTTEGGGVASTFTVIK